MTFKISRYTILLVTFLIIPLSVRGAQIFDNGQVNNYSSIDATGARVWDSSAGTPTTLNVLSGAFLGGTFVYENSRMNVYAGAVFNNEINMLNNSELIVYGGDIFQVDVQDQARAVIAGGNFYDATRRIGAFSEGSVMVFGGGVEPPVYAWNDAWIHVINGEFFQTLRAEHEARITIIGGQVNDISATAQSTIVLYGRDFQVYNENGIMILDGFGEITDSLDGMIHGILADETLIEADAFNGVAGSRIVLTELICSGDFEPDGSVDGADLSLLARFGGVDLALFTAHFGRIGCLP